jgi:hypothetical protein
MAEADSTDRRSFLTKLSGISAMALMSPVATIEAEETTVAAIGLVQEKRCTYESL